ncbi:hypothetical protein FRB91_001204 [Serendipita sp. 411]|nr:hypothetical protein FRC18_001524 [Serendipita sp. 400]KAG8846070.1 hypothetical protein FRB91_001204 [Serendipita sp. 411]
MYLIADFLKYSEDPVGIETFSLLYCVCKRFYTIFRPFAFEVFCFGNVRVVERMYPRMAGCNAVKEVQDLHVGFSHIQEEVNMNVIRPSILKFLRQFENLKCISLRGFTVDVRLLIQLGRMRHLETLSYEIGRPGDFYAISSPPWMADDFLPSQLFEESQTHLFPSRLRTLKMKWLCIELDPLSCFALVLFHVIARSSASTLEDLHLDFSEFSDSPTLDTALCNTELPRLKRLTAVIKHGFWKHCQSVFNDYLHQLESVDITFTHSSKEWYFGEEIHPLRIGNDETHSFGDVYLRDVPGIVDTDITPGEIDCDIGLFSINLQTDCMNNVTAQEFSMIGGCLHMLSPLTKRHPYIRVLSLWDCLPNNMMQGLLDVSHNLLHLEFLRFNARDHGIDGKTIGQCIPFPLCDTEESNSFCSCASCELGVYSETGRVHLQEEWEQTAWMIYEAQVRQLVAHFSRLRLLEWFLVEEVGDFPWAAFPFWQFAVIRGCGSSETPANFRLRRRLWNWPQYDRDPIIHGNFSAFWYARGLRHLDEEPKSIDMYAWNAEHIPDWVVDPI